VCARVSTLVGPPDQVYELANYAAERVMPAFRDLDGSNGLLGLADRQRGRVLVVGLWEAEEAVDQLRRGAAEVAGETIGGVDKIRGRLRRGQRVTKV
jgi:hypothetical protein